VRFNNFYQAGRANVIEIALQAAEDLTKKHHPEFIVLYGSIARGDYTDESDIDLACFCENPSVSKDVRLFKGKKLDCWLYSLSEAVPEKKEFLRFVGGRLLLDKQGEGRQFLTEVTQVFEAGPEPIKPDATDHLKEWAKNMLHRAAGNSVEAHYRRTWLPCALLEIYFELRNRWYLGSKQSFSWLSENDASTLVLFEKAFANPTDLKVLSALVSAALNTDHAQSSG